MEPLLSSEMEGGEAKERRKIQFSVPSSVPIQLDPRQVEMIRRRRPTPATLFRLTDHPTPEDDLCSHQNTTEENGVLKHMRSNIAVYQPPSLQVVQKMAQAHMLKFQSSPEGGSTSLSPDSDEDFPEDSEPTDQSEERMGSKVTAVELPNILQTEPPDEEGGGK
ncbi:protein phosphatase 1 regulatory subunit 1B-like [Engraulis encrasicolus]|uniref:protein phosphatase 1 regulatory subunit 1B-like n=1 Tax=Engraulis encrasicolus TaxID=184585 RepID=UPI002FD4E5FE